MDSISIFIKRIGHWSKFLYTNFTYCQGTILVFFVFENINLQLKIKNKKRHSPGIYALEDAWDKIKNLNLTTSHLKQTKTFLLR